MSETKDVLREVVKSPWFEWDAVLATSDLGGEVAGSMLTEKGRATHWVADHDVNVGPLLSMLRAHPRVMSTYLISCSRTEGATHDVVVDLRASAGAAGGGGPTGPAEYEGATDVQALAHAILALPGKP